MTERTRRGGSPGNGTVSEEDSALFRDTVGAVRPLPETRAPLERTAGRPKPMPRRRREVAERIEQIDSPFEPAVEGGEPLSFARAGVPSRWLRRLRRGQLSVERELDLHGLLTEDAGPALERFLSEAGRLRLRCVRIIHGKGLGSPSGRAVMKAKVSYWLERDPRVLAYCSAPRAVGGTGALNVLLKV